MQADVVVIGGGLTGVLTTYLLVRAGKKVVLVERDTLGGGTTELTTAFLTQSIDTALTDLVRMFGEDGARMVWQSGADAIRELERIAIEHGADSEMMPCSARVYAKDTKELEELKREADVARQLGFEVSLKHDGALHFSNAGYMEIPGQAKFHPVRFLQLVAAKAAELGAVIHEHTEVVSLSEDGNAVATTVSGNMVHAHDVVVTTYAPFNNPRATHFKKGIYQSYVLEVHTAHTQIPEGIYWDTHRPYNYFRIDRQADGDRIIVGGADHRRELPVSRKKSFRALERYLKGVLGDTPYHIIRTWSGPIIEASDGLPLIGEYAPHRYVATAFSGNGMTYAMVAALLMRDTLTGIKNPWVNLYDPKRPLKLYRLLIKGRDYIQEFFGGAVKNSLH